MDRNLSKLWETVEDGGASSAAVHGIAKSRPWLSNWTTTNPILCVCVCAKSGNLSSGIIKIKENDYEGLSVAYIQQVLCGGTY